MRNTFTSITGVVIAVAGLLWIYELATDTELPWQWILAIGLVLFGLAQAFSRPATDGKGGVPPSQFERDDAPRVP